MTLASLIECSLAYTPLCPGIDGLATTTMQPSLHAPLSRGLHTPLPRGLYTPLSRGLHTPLPRS